MIRTKTIAMVCALAAGIAPLSACHAHGDPAVSPDQSHLPLTVDTDTREDGAIIAVTALAKPAGTEADLYRLSYRTDRFAVTGYAVIPAGAAGPMPVVLFAHGGAGKGDRIGGPVLTYLASLAERGQVVILASDYRDKDEYGGADVDDIANLLPIARRLKMADPERVAMLGFSRGGLETYVAMHSGLALKAAVVVSGPADLGDAWSKLDLPTQHKISNLVGGTPSGRPDSYRDRSAIAWAEDLHAPLLILQGDADKRVPVAEAIALDARLSALGRPHKLIVVPGGDHMLHNAADRRDAAILDWFSTYLR